MYVILPITIIGAAFIGLVFSNSNRQIIMGGDNTSVSYYLSDPIILLTIVIPILLAWAFGFFGSLLIKLFQKHTKGIIYKKLLSKLSHGIIAVVLGSISLQFILSLGTERLINMGIGPLMALIYLFLILQGLGYYWIAKGAKDLKSIENNK